MIGDKLIDMEAGRNYGVRTVLVGTGYGAGVHEEQKKKGDSPMTCTQTIYWRHTMKLTEKQQEILRSCLYAIRFLRRTGRYFKGI